jgi:hypothetical protein
MYQASLVNQDTLSRGCTAVAQAAAQLLIVCKSLIASCFQDQVVLKPVESARSFISKSPATYVVSVALISCVTGSTETFVHPVYSVLVLTGFQFVQLKNFSTSSVVSYQRYHSAGVEGAVLDIR